MSRTTETEVKQQNGRPPKHNWAAEKAAIERKIKKGLGLGLLGKPYGMTPAGMRRVVKQLGLRTLGMKKEGV